MIAKMIALDWRAMKFYQKRFVLLPVFAFLAGWSNPILVIPVCVIMFLSFSVNPFAVEEKGELNNLYLTLPVKRNSIVTGRYVLSFIMLLCGIIMGIAIMPLANSISYSKWYIGFDGIIALISLSYLLYVLFNLFMFPILFWLGYQKGKFLGFYLPASFFGILYAAYYIFNSLGNGTLTLDFIVYASENILLVSGGMIVLSTVILFLSYTISIKLYSKRDF